MSRTKLVLLGTGTPNAEAQGSGPSSAVIVDDKAYIVDFGAGVVRQASKAFQMGIDALNPKNLKVAFSTHLHSDHTTGLADLIFTPWVLERDEPLKIFGPKGTKHMVDCITAAYEIDIDFRINGFEKANEVGYKTEVTEITEGVVYKDELVTVEAFTAVHGTLECYSYKFTTPDKVIVISGDTCPTQLMIDKAKGCDILLHEVYYSAGLAQRLPKWQKYHSEVHTGALDLGKMCCEIKPKQLVTYHRIYHTEVQQNKINIISHLKEREYAILDEIKSVYDGAACNGQDLDVFI
ncbi:MAG: MBL fold metallo-hydrolase [Oscillospiraceae bacterium]|nr:MBL fold metallo-hydrolase [Oscillospiraceae bacterium]